MNILFLILLIISFLIGVILFFRKHVYVGGLLLVLSIIGIIILCTQSEFFSTVDLQCDAVSCPDKNQYKKNAICDLIKDLHSWTIKDGKITYIKGIQDQDDYAFRGRVKVAQQLDLVCNWLNRDVSQNTILLNTLMNYFYNDYPFQAGTGFLTSPIADMIKSAFKGTTFVNSSQGIPFNIIVNKDQDVNVVINNIEYQFNPCRDQFIKTDDQETTVVLIMSARVSYVVGNVSIDIQLTNFPDIPFQNLSNNMFITVNNHDCELGFVIKPDITDLSSNMIISLGYIQFKQINSQDVTIDNIEISDQDLPNVFVGSLNYLPNYNCIVTTRFEDKIYESMNLPRDMTFLFQSDWIKSFQSSIQTMIKNPLIGLGTYRFIKTKDTDVPINSKKDVGYVNFINSYFSSLMNTVVYAATNGFNVGLYPPIEPTTGKGKNVPFDKQCFYPDKCTNAPYPECKDFSEGVCTIPDEYKGKCCEGGSFKFVDLTCRKNPEKAVVFLITQTVLSYIDAIVPIFYGVLAIGSLGALAALTDLKAYEKLVVQPFRLLDCKDGSYQLKDPFDESGNLQKQFFSCVGDQDIRVCYFSLQVNPNLQLQDFHFLGTEGNDQMYSMVFNMLDNIPNRPNLININIKAKNTGYFQYLSTNINLEDIPFMPSYNEIVETAWETAGAAGSALVIAVAITSLLYKFAPYARYGINAIGSIEKFTTGEGRCASGALTEDQINSLCLHSLPNDVIKLFDYNENLDCLETWKQKYDALQQAKAACIDKPGDYVCQLDNNNPIYSIYKNFNKDNLKLDTCLDQIKDKIDCDKNYNILLNEFTTSKNITCPMNYTFKWDEIHDDFKKCAGSAKPTICPAEGLLLSVDKYQKTCDVRTYNDLKNKASDKNNPGDECKTIANNVRRKIETIHDDCTKKQDGSVKSKEELQEDQKKANFINKVKDKLTGLGKTEMVEMLKKLTTICYPRELLKGDFWELNIGLKTDSLQIKLNGAKITSDQQKNTAKFTNLEDPDVVQVLYDQNNIDIDLDSSVDQLASFKNIDSYDTFMKLDGLHTGNWITIITFGMVREFIKSIFSESTKDKIISDIQAICAPIVIIFPEFEGYVIRITQIVNSIYEAIGTGATGDDKDKRNKRNAARQKLLITLGAILVDIIVKRYVTNKVQDKVQDGIRNASYNLLKQLDLPFALPELYLFDNDFDCVCTNVCARNWNNILTKHDPSWKSSSCVNAIDASNNPVSCDTYFVTGQKNQCLCMNTTKQADSAWEPNASSQPPVTYCNAPLYVYDVLNINDPSNNPVSCDFVCQQNISSYYPAIKGSYCLNARLPNTNQNIPCAQQTTVNTECLCYKDNSLFIEGVTSRYNIYGILIDPLIYEDIYIYCGYNGKFLVNFKNSSGNRIVNGLPINNGSLDPYFTQTFMTLNIYGERSIWTMIPTVGQSGLIPSIQNPNIFFLVNKFDDGFLYDPNDPIPFDITTMTKEELMKHVQFVELTLINKEAIKNDNVTRCLWKIIKSGTKYSFVNVYSNRCILGFDASQIKTAFNGSMTNGGPLLGLQSAPGSYNNYNQINLWQFKQAQAVAPSDVNLTTELQVVNLTNVAYQSVMTYVGQFNNIPNNVELKLSDNSKISLSVTQFQKKLIPMPYPSSTYLPNNQFLLEKNGQYYKIRSLLNTETNYLIEDEVNGWVSINVVDQADATDWKIDAIEKYHTITSVKTKRVLIRTAPSFDQMKEMQSADFETRAKATQTYGLVTSDFKFFITVNIDKIENNDYSHIPRWSVTLATPVMNPINNQRLNVVCPTQSRLSVDSLEPDFKYCNTQNTISLSDVNILQSDNLNNTSCIVNTPSVLEMIAPGKDTAANLMYYAGVENLNVSNKIPNYTSLTSPCYLYGGRSRFSIDGSLTGLNIRTSSPDKCLILDTNNKMIEGDCPATPLWKLKGLNVNPSNKMTLSAVTDYLYNYDYYYCVNTFQNLLMTYEDNKFSLEYATETFNNEESLKTFDGSNNRFARVQFIKNLTTQNNYLRFVSRPGPNFIGCKIDPSSVKINPLTARITDLNYSTYCKDASGVKWKGQYLPPISTNMLDGGLYDNTPENQGAISIEFILVNYVSSPTNETIYCYLIRLKNPVKINDNFYTAYLATSQDGSEVNVKFIVWPVENNEYDYSITISPYLQCLLKTFNNQVKWVFTNVQNLSNNDSGNLRTYQITDQGGSMCLTKFGAIDKDGQFVCNPPGCTPYENLNVSYFGLEKCQDNNTSQQFFFQSPEYQPADFPYLKESSIPDNPDPTKTFLFNSNFRN